MITLDDAKRCAASRGNRVELAQRHCLVGAVLDAGHAAAVVDLAHDAEEKQDRAMRRRRDLAHESRGIDGIANQPGHRGHPPATGGMSAISSPDDTRVDVAA